MLGRYQVLKHLASGGMAEVLIARAGGIEGFERHVVIKRIHAERARDEQVVKMFLDEARLAASLHHTNIVQVHDIGQEKGEYFFAMEYVHGEDLRRLLTEVNRAQQTIPLEHVLTMVMSAAAALHYAHEHRGPDRKPLGIVHRDVSPANILLGYDGNVKVVDFGIAKAAIRSTETQSGTLKGKISYMSPEQCLGQPVDRRSDVFALGIVLYELAVVRRLFKGSSDFLTMSSIVAGNIPKPSEHRPDLPPALEAIMMKALALSPDDRYQSADELRQALEQFATAANLRGTTTGLADYMHQIFGVRPEPWLVEDDPPEHELDVDFDGSGNGLGVISTGVNQRLKTPPPGSLLARARRKVAAPGGVPVMPATPSPARDGSAPVQSGWGAGDKAPTTASGTPLAWTPVPPAVDEIDAPTPRRKRRLLLATIPLALVAVAAVVFLQKGGDRADGSTPSSGAATAPKEKEPTPAAVAPAPPPPTPAPATASATAPVTGSADGATDGSATGSGDGSAAIADSHEPTPVEPTVTKTAATKTKTAATKTTTAAKAGSTTSTASTKTLKTKTKTTTTKTTKSGSWDPTSLLPN